MANRGQIHWLKKSVFVNSIFKNGLSYLTKYSLTRIDLYHKSNYKINIPNAACVLGQTAFFGLSVKSFHQRPFPRLNDS